MKRRFELWLLGPVVGGLGLGVGHLFAAWWKPSASPVLAVGSTVIDMTPRWAKEWAIEQFGSSDKTVLIGSVLVVVLALTTLIGPLTRRRSAFGYAAFVGLSIVAAVAAILRPGASLSDAVPSVVTAVVATLALFALQSMRDAPFAPNRPLDGTPSRRAVLMVMGVMAASAAAAGELGRVVIGARARPESITLPKPHSPAPPLPEGLDRTVAGISPFRTPTARFYRVDTRLDVPVIDSTTWNLRVDGNVARPFTITYDELMAMPMIERDITLTCVSNSVGGPYVGAGRWLGVPLVDLLGRAGVDSRADQILSTDFDGMTISTPLALAADGRDSMIAVGLNGSALPREHGFPARLLVPGLYGFIGATKWVNRLTLTTYAAQQAYWTRRGWATDAPIKISARIDTPHPLEDVHAGEVVIGGVAWAQRHGGVAKVEVAIDGGDWQGVTLGPSGGNDYWRQWFYRWQASPGTHTIAARVTDGAGEVQSTIRTTPFPAGSSGIQTISVTVS